MAITVVLPVYNSERFLRPAIESVLGQSFQDFQLLAIDDGSTDSSPDILEAFRKADKRVRAIRRPHLGYTSTLNFGITSATNDLIALMDADDLMMPNRLERQLLFITSRPNASVVCSYAYLIDIQNRIIGAAKNTVDVEKGIANRDPTLFSEIVNPSVLMRKKDIIQIGGYRESFIFAPDRDLWARLATSGFSIQSQPEFLLRYRLHLGALSAQTMQRNALFSTFSNVNFKRRLLREPEITFDEYLVQRRQRPLLEQMNEWRKWTALMYYKRAARYRGECQWLGTVHSLTMAVSLAPSYVIKRAWSKSKIGHESDEP